MDLYTQDSRVMLGDQNYDTIITLVFKIPPKKYFKEPLNRIVGSEIETYFQVWVFNGI